MRIKFHGMIERRIIKIIRLGLFSTVQQIIDIIDRRLHLVLKFFITVIVVS